MITPLTRGNIRELHTAIVDLEKKGYEVISPARQVIEDMVSYKRGRYSCSTNTKWVCIMKKQNRRN